MTGFPTELLVLAALMILAASMWIPYIIGVTSDPTDTTDFTRPGDLTALRPWVHRAHRAHLNLLEQAIPFGVLVIIIDRLDGFTALTAGTAIAFLILRLIHAAGMISGTLTFPARPVVFTAGWVCCLIMGYAVFAAA